MHYLLKAARMHRDQTAEAVELRTRRMLLARPITALPCEQQQPARFDISSHDDRKLAWFLPEHRS
jgi:hypothetical protein